MTTFHIGDADPVQLDLASLNDEQLALLVADIMDEQHRRAVDAKDVDAMVEDAFDKGFVGGQAALPWIDSGLLFCPGLLVDKSKASHDCTFVSVANPGGDSTWVWESDSVVEDAVRHLPSANRHQLSVTVVTAYEGMDVDVVVSQLRQGQHRMKKASSFKIVDGKLKLVSTRAQKTTGHR